MASHQEQTKEMQTQKQTQTQKQEQLLPTTIEFIFTYCSVNVPFSIAMKSQFLSDMVEDIGIQCIEDGKLNIIYDYYEFTKEELELYFYLVETYYTSGYNVLANTILENNISPQLLCNFIKLSDFLNITLFIDALCENMADYTSSFIQQV